MKQFTNLYSLSKTLRFELIPQGKTLQNFKKSGILEEDEERAEKYKEVKKIIDEYHKEFIEKKLSNITLDINEYYSLYMQDKKTAKEKNNFQKAQENLRKQIVNAFGKNELKELFGEKLITEYLPEFIEKHETLSKEEKEDIQNKVNDFKKFTTYFKGFHENRKNIYSDEEKSTAISYRLINENLPKFINNLSVFKKVKDILSKEIKVLYDNIKNDLNDKKVKKIADIFDINYYSKVLTQKQIDFYNLVIGGKTLDDKTKIKGLNEYINLYNQTQTDKTKKLPKFTFLFKQILSDRISISVLPEKFENDEELLESIANAYDDIKENIEKIKKQLGKLKDFDLSKIYIRNDALNEISQNIFGDYSKIIEALKDKIRANNPQTKKESAEKYYERINKIFKNNESFSIEYIEECLEQKDIITEYFMEGKIKSDEEDLFSTIEKKYLQIKDLLNIENRRTKPLIQDTQSIELIKEFLDSIKNLQYFIKPLRINAETSDIDAVFYGDFNSFCSEIDRITPLYNKVRNYFTQKPYSTEKIKLNFENSTLLGGWDLNKEEDNRSVILRKDGLYFLAIIDKKNSKVFNEKEVEGNGYEKMEYKQIALSTGVGGFVRKCFESAQKFGWKCPQNCKDKEGKIIITNDEAASNLSLIIDCYKDFFNKYEKDGFKYKNFGFKFSKSADYKKLSDFFSDVKKQSYKVKFKNISKEYVDKLVEEGKIYLFQIYNKDFSKYSKGTPNMHTLYWKALFDEDNLKNVVYKLNGQAEIFYRKASIDKENMVIHKANKAIENKNINNKTKESKFDYDIIKDRRYTVDKFHFHVPITMNFKAIGNHWINEEVNQFIRDNNIKHIIGIDRGERHLLYLSLIDLKGNIIKQFSLNEIINEYNGNFYKTNYHALLDKREKERDDAKKSWQTIESIKELKEGYISQVIHKISQLMIEYKAIVVLEDLNFGFMRGRQKVEKQVYQKFEKMLIDKLNYLVDKKKDKNVEGGLLKAYQLTNKFESFKKMGKQNGFLFYIPAWNTSKIDSVTGFVNLFDTRYKNIEKAKDFFNKFEDIKFNKDKNYFEFEVKDYSEFNSKAEGTRLNWTICTNADRIETFGNKEKNNQWDRREINLTKEFITLFDTYKINYKDNLKEQIVNQTEKEFFKELLNLFRLTVQMRNSITGTEIDYLISPVADKTGNFFDSRKNINNLPNNADANGAYNIARKGLWVIEQIKNAESLKKVNFAISNKEWLQFTQGKKREKEL